MNILFPSVYLDSVYAIDYEKVKELGYKAIIFDIDSTLVPHGDDTSDQVDELFAHIHDVGLKTLLLSNNSDERIALFNRNIQTLYIPMANKPHKPNFFKAIDMLGVNRSEVLLVGDQIFTDVLGANLCGIDNVLVNFLKHKEDINIGKKRQVEKLILQVYTLLYKKRKHRLSDIVVGDYKKMDKKKKLFCEIHPAFYAISVRKGILKRHVDNLRQKTKFARTFKKEQLPNVVHSYSTHLIKKGKDIDPELQYNKAYNIQLASSKMDGIIIKPGEEFSFWKLVGKINKKNGYKDGRVIINNKVQPGMGGGLCNLANSINLLIQHSPLEVTELHTHSDALSPDHGKRVPFGTGTSITYNYIDYRFKNTTDQTIQINLWVENETSYTELRSEKPFPVKFNLIERDHHFTKVDGKFYRKSNIYKETIDKKTNKVIKEELVYKNNSEVLFDYDLIPKDLVV